MDNLVEYYNNNITSEEVLSLSGVPVTLEREEVIALSQREWDNVEIDEEGATAAQDAALDQVLESTADALLS